LNYYHDGKDEINPHNDNEKGWALPKDVVTLAVYDKRGEKRDFRISNKK